MGALLGNRPVSGDGNRAAAPPVRFSPGDCVVIGFDRAWRFRGVRLRAGRGGVRITRSAEAAGEDATVVERLNALGRALGVSRGMRLYFTGDVADGTYFKCRTVELPRKEQSESLRFELERHLAHPAGDQRIAYAAAAAGREGEVDIRAYAVPASGLAALTEALAVLGWRPDGLVYPLLALPELPPGAAVALPELGTEFFRRDGAWLPMEMAPAKCNDELAAALQRFCTAGFIRDDRFLACEMAGIFVMRSVPVHERPYLEVFPEALAPRRFRNLLRLTAALLALWALFGIWAGAGRVWSHIRETGALKSELDDYENKRADLARRIKQGDRAYKEQQRILEQDNGDAELLGKLALVTQVIPDDVMLSSLRANGNAWELTLMTDSSEVDMASQLRRLRNCRMTNLTERTMGDSLRMITARLEWR